MKNEYKIQLIAFQAEDEALFTKWLDKSYIFKWFCCDGKDNEKVLSSSLEERQAWLDEIINREKRPHAHLFIVTCDGSKIGFGICIDLTGEPEYLKETYPDLNGKIKAGEVFELGYCIGEETYLGKGIGRIIIKRLEEASKKLGALLLLADPNEENLPSVKVLLANGFERHKGGDYRKNLH